VTHHGTRNDVYEPPTLRVLGSVAELTQLCGKQLGGSDIFIFRGNALVCTSP